MVEDRDIEKVKVDLWIEHWVLQTE